MTGVGGRPRYSETRAQSPCWRFARRFNSGTLSCKGRLCEPRRVPPLEGGLQWLFSPDLAVGTDQQGHSAVFVRAGRVLYSRVERCAIAGATRV